MSTTALRPDIDVGVAQMDLGFEGSPASRVRSHIMFTQLRHGKKWFDSGEFFLAKEGKQCPDLIPGGAPVEMAEPKLSPSTPPERKPTRLVHVQIATPPSRHQVSDY